jgi:hypothetical protein
VWGSNGQFFVRAVVGRVHVIGVDALEEMRFFGRVGII